MKINYIDDVTEKTYTLTLTGFITELKEYLPYSKMPPFEILNLFLEEGVVDADMNGGMLWAPFNLNKEEFNEHVIELCENEFCKLPNGLIKSIQDWEIWCDYLLFGIPIDSHKKLNNRIALLESQYENAHKENNLELIKKIDWDIYLAREKLDMFTSKYVYPGCNKNLIAKFSYEL